MLEQGLIGNNVHERRVDMSCPFVVLNDALNSFIVHVFLQVSNIDMVKLLLDHGATVTNLKDNQEMSILVYAAINNHADVVPLLANYGATLSKTCVGMLQSHHQGASSKGTHTKQRARSEELHSVLDLRRRRSSSEDRCDPRKSPRSVRAAAVLPVGSPPTLLPNLMPPSLLPNVDYAGSLLGESPSMGQVA